MNRAIEIHDSILDSITIREGLVELHFSSAYVHESAGSPGVDVGSGWMQEAYLRIGRAVIAGAFSKLPCDMWSGYIKLSGSVHDNSIPVPLDHRSDVELQLEGRGGAILITGSSAKLELVGDATYLEEFG